jgi:hypothetical protein
MTARQEHQDRSVAQATPSGRSLTWQIHPVKRKPLLSVVVTLAVLLFSFLVYASTESTFFTVLSLVVLFASLTKFYWPTSYTLTEKDVIIKTTYQTLHKEWSLYRSSWPDKNGILLSPFVEQSRLENFRGLYILFGNNRDDVIVFVNERIAAQSKGKA